MATKKNVAEVLESLEASVEMIDSVETNENTVDSVDERTIESYMEQYKTKSAVIRALHAEGRSRGAISKFMNIRYQHVRNVLITPLKKM